MPLGRLKDTGKMQPAQVSPGKRNDCRISIDFACRQRDILGGACIITERSVIRHALNLESVITYDGTETVHELVVGRELTGINIFWRKGNIMLSNKRFLKITCAVSAVIGLGTATAMAATPDFRKAADSTTQFLRLRCTLNPSGQVYLWWTGTVYAQIPGQKLKALMGFEGYNVCRTAKAANGDWQMLTREVGYYRDLQTGKIIEHWDNPYTGKTDEVVAVRNDPVNSTIPAHGRSNQPMPWKIVGDDVMVLLDSPLSYPNALSPAAFPEESSGPQYLASEHFGFFAKLADMDNSKLDDVPSAVSWFRTGPWLPWMKMGQRPGGLIYSAQGKKLEHGFADLPADVQAYTRKHFPTFVNAPTRYVTPNETSWTVYRDMKRAQTSGTPSNSAAKTHL